jgi:hypothetical protein
LNSKPNFYNSLTLALKSLHFNLPNALNLSHSLKNFYPKKSLFAGELKPNLLSENHPFSFHSFSSLYSTNPISETNPKNALNLALLTHRFNPKSLNLNYLNLRSFKIKYSLKNYFIL